MANQTVEQNTKMRLLHIAQILYEETDSNHSYSTNELMDILMDRFGIYAHRQTIPTDMEALRAMGFNIREHLGTQKTYWIEDRIFKPAEIKMLIDSVSSAKFITKKKSTELQEKLLKMVSRNEAKGLARNISVENRVKRDNEQVYGIIDAVNKAINQGRKISFTYFRYDVKKKPQLRNEGQPYVLSPQQLVWNGDYYYVVGVNNDKQVRIFRLDRMEKEPQILWERSIPFPKDFSMNKFLNTSFRMFGTDYTPVILRCDNDVVDAILDRFGKNTKLEPVDDDHFRIRVELSASNVFYSWVFGFGGKVKIDAPRNIKEEYKKMLQDAAENL